MIIAKDAGERDSGYVEPAENYAEPSYGLTEAMGELDPAVGFIIIATLQKAINEIKDKCFNRD